MTACIAAKRSAQIAAGLLLAAIVALLALAAIQRTFDWPLDRPHDPPAGQHRSLSW